MTAGELSFLHVFSRRTSPARPRCCCCTAPAATSTTWCRSARPRPRRGPAQPARARSSKTGMPRFFRRLAEGVFDVEDLRVRAGELADFVAAAAAHYRIRQVTRHRRGVFERREHRLRAAAVPSRLLPARCSSARWCTLVPDPLPLLSARVLILNGRSDPLVSSDETERSWPCSAGLGAHVETAWQPGGHQLTQGDVTVAQRWLLQTVTTNL